MIHLSPCLKAPADTPIQECIVRMNEARVGSILVVGDRAEERGLLQGIFTERDVLRNFELLRSDDLAQRPVRTLMTKAVQTIEITELHLAPQRLLQGGFRHLPVVAGSSVPSASTEPERTLLGVLSIRDVLKWQIEGSPFATVPSSEKRSAPLCPVWLRTADPEMKKLFHHVFHSLNQTGWNFQPLYADSARMVAPRAKVLDLDSIPIQNWKQQVVELAGSKSPERTPLVLLFEPSLHGSNVLSSLKQLEGHVEGLSIFSKPVDLLKLVGTLTQLS